MRLKTLTSNEQKENEHYKSLLSKKYGLTFFEPIYVEVPFVSSQFENPEIKKRISRFENFLLNTFTIDMGTNDHREMNQIRKKFTTDEYNWHKYHNKLGINNWGTISGSTLGVLNRLLLRDDLHVNHSIEKQDYSRLPFEYKVKFCDSIDAEINRILINIYQE